MKITIISTAYPLRGGIAHYVGLLTKHLRNRHSVDVITFKRQYPKLFFPGKTQNEPATSIENIEPAPQLVDSINPLNWISVARHITKQKPDLLLFKYWLPFFGPCFGTIARLVKRWCGAKVIFICDNVIPHERRPGDKLFTRYALGTADAVIVQSKSVEKDLLHYFPKVRYALAVHPIYENFGNALPKKDARQQLGISAEKVILTFGYIRPYKGVLVLLDAMKYLNDIYLLVVGEFYDDEKKYRDKVQNLKIESRVRFISDYVPNDQVAPYFSAADLVVLPYLSATQSGIAQIAYHFEKPIIATNVGGLSEVVLNGITGYVVEPNNPSALADSINRFYNEGKEMEFIENIRNEKKKYSWDNLVEKIEMLAK